MVRNRIHDCRPFTKSSELFYAEQNAALVAHAEEYYRNILGADERFPHWLAFSYCVLIFRQHLEHPR